MNSYDIGMWPGVAFLVVAIGMLSQQASRVVDFPFPSRSARLTLSVPCNYSFPSEIFAVGRENIRIFD